MLRPCGRSHGASDVQGNTEEDIPYTSFADADLECHTNSRSIASGRGRLGAAEIFDAEEKGALKGLKAALDTRGPSRSPIAVRLDNLAAAGCLQGTPSDSSQDVFLEFQALTATRRAIEIRWVPSYTKILGNEEINALAKEGCSYPEPDDALPTLAHL
ncbi:hypothetical protein LI328DRAFT_169878 [Trichoderma asperelloides]|nr:hypothetical protein LI328DRAFT_169878 [Trichoderma asperelloides]